MFLHTFSIPKQHGTTSCERSFTMLSHWQHLAASGSIWHGLVHLVQLLLRLLHSLAWHVVRPRSTQVDPASSLASAEEISSAFSFFPPVPWHHHRMDRMGVLARPGSSWIVLDRPGSSWIVLACGIVCRFALPILEAARDESRIAMNRNRGPRHGQICGSKHF